MAWLPIDRGRDDDDGCYKVDWSGVAGDPLTFSVDVTTADGLAPPDRSWASKAVSADGTITAATVTSVDGATLDPPQVTVTRIYFAFAAFVRGRRRYDVQHTATATLTDDPETVVAGVIVAEREVTAP